MLTLLVHICHLTALCYIDYTPITDPSIFLQPLGHDVEEKGQVRSIIFTDIQTFMQCTAHIVFSEVYIILYITLPMTTSLTQIRQIPPRPTGWLHPQTDR